MSLQNENVNREATSVSLLQDVRRPTRRTGHKNLCPKTFMFREAVWTTFFQLNYWGNPFCGSGWNITKPTVHLEPTNLIKVMANSVPLKLNPLNMNPILFEWQGVPKFCVCFSLSWAMPWFILSIELFHCGFATLGFHWNFSIWLYTAEG